MSNGIERLRNAIDRGETRDKVPFSDPAAAPLGADDEAAGVPPSRSAVDLAMRNEVEPRRTAAPGMSDETRRDPLRSDRTPAWPPPRVFIAMAASAAAFVLAASAGVVFD